MNSRTKIGMVILFATWFFLPGQKIFSDSNVAFCSETGAWGVCWGGEDSTNCSNNKCTEYGGTACKELLHCDNEGYGAVAQGENGSIGAYCGGKSAADAKRQALSFCRKNGGKNCTIKADWNG